MKTIRISFAVLFFTSGFAVADEERECRSNYDLCVIVCVAGMTEDERFVSRFPACQERCHELRVPGEDRLR